MKPELPPTGSAAGQEAQDAARAVLEDQASRREKEQEGPTKGRSRVPEAVAMALAAISLWMWISPPEMLRPAGIPEPPPIVLESGLRLDLYMVAVQILRFQLKTGTLPATADEAVTDPIAADNFEYAVRGRDHFQLTAERDGQVVVYSSDQSLPEFLGSSYGVLEESGP